MYSFVPIQGNRVLASVIVYNHYKRNALEFTCVYNINYSNCTIL